MAPLVLANIIISFAALVLIVVSVIGAAREASWSLGKRWLWGILSFALGLLGSGVAFWLRGRKALAATAGILLVLNIIITLIIFKNIYAP